MALVGYGAGAETCRDIENDLDRLACYDRESGRSPVAETSEGGAGNWHVSVERSEFKDTTDVYLSVESDEPLDCGLFGSPKPARLWIRCLENTTSIFIDTSCHMASGFGGYGRVEYRIDDRAAEQRSFDASTDNRALGLWNGRRAIPMVRKLLGAKRLITRFTPFNESPVVAHFDISGLEDAIGPLREACHW